MTAPEYWQMLLKMIDVSEQTALADIERRLTVEFPEATADAIDAAVKEAHSRFAASRIRDFVPLFVEKNARHQLSHRAVPAT
ncbi:MULTISPECIES: three-helix bundle dimerization domain-containing protein [unclassified Mycolicibacterium]|uniref:three-helix bundle dimerization domain-containing protein n=1 Tax=unclassified Mycolicibacterium TaxID=2636767 RepID=UPI002EDAD3B9